MCAFTGVWGNLASYVCQDVILTSFPRACVCVRNPEFNVAIDSRIFAVRASRAHEVHYVSTARRLRQSSSVHRPENMGFISQDDSLFPLFYFYGGSVSRSIAPTRKQIYRAAVLTPHSQCASKAACGSLSLGVRNSDIICEPKESRTRLKKHQG